MEFCEHKKVAIIRLVFFLYQFRNGLTALLWRRAVIKGTIQTAAEVSMTKVTLVSAADCLARRKLVFAGMARSHCMDNIAEQN